jgi:hypothetical protein
MKKIKHTTGYNNQKLKRKHMKKITSGKILCYMACMGLVVCLGHNAAAQSSWIDTDLNGLWDDPNNWSGGAPSSAAGWFVTINPAPGPSCTIQNGDVIDVGTLSDDSSTYGTVYGPEFGATLNMTGNGSLTVNWTIAPVQNNPVYGARSYLNMYNTSSLTVPNGASLNFGDAWWWTGGPYVTMNMYNSSSYTSSGGAGLWLGGHVNIYDTASFFINGYVNMDIAEANNDATRSINVGGGTLTLPEGTISGGNSGSAASWITRGILRAYGKGFDSADLSITDNGNNTIVTATPLGGSLQSVSFSPLLVSPAPVGSMQQLVLVGNYPAVTEVLLSSAEPGVDPATFPTPVYTSSDTCVVTVDANGVATAVAPGTATISATVGSHTASPITFTVSHTTSMSHRYSFTASSGTTVPDSITGSPSYAATLIGGATLGGGQVTLDGSTGYVQLPAGILAGAGDVAIETWASFGNPVNTWAGLFAFGYNDESGDANDGLGGDYIAFQPHTGGAGTQQAFGQGLPGFDDESDAVWATPLDGMTGAHVVAVYQPSANSFSFYINGVFEASQTIYNNLLDPVSFAGAGGSILAETFGAQAINDEAGNEVIADPDNFIGRDCYSDPYLNGSIAEFRIYNGPLTAAQIAADYALGPNAIIGSNTHVSLKATLSSGNIVITWPTTSAYVTLVSTTSLTNGDCWTPVSNGTLAIVGANYVETVPITGNSQFFGLQ